MSIKKICKKLFVSLLVATTYIPFGVKINDAINSNYPAIYASENGYPIQGEEDTSWLNK